MSSRVKTYLGIDWGTKRIGLAIGDSSTRLASPFQIVGDLEEVLSIISFEEIDEIVIGEPLKMCDITNDMDSAYIEFVIELEKSIGKPVIKIDERLTSKHADSLPGGKKTKASRDTIAAMLILQTYLDTLKEENF
jgi:putative Holliday junction resolvase